MDATQILRSRFENCYGEIWEFEYDPAKRVGILRGSDVEWRQYRVVCGLVPDLILNDEEARWLRIAWYEATGEVAPLCWTELLRLCVAGFGSGTPDLVGATPLPNSQTRNFA